MEESKIGYIIGAYDIEENQCFYLKNKYGTNVFRAMIDSARVFTSVEANYAVECNDHPNGGKLLKKSQRKTTRLFVSKVYTPDDKYNVRLTKLNSFQLLEQVTYQL